MSELTLCLLVEGLVFGLEFQQTIWIIGDSGLTMFVIWTTCELVILVFAFETDPCASGYFIVSTIVGACFLRNARFFLYSLNPSLFALLKIEFYSSTNGRWKKIFSKNPLKIINFVFVSNAKEVLLKNSQSKL